MRYYRQHPIVLVATLMECLILGVLSIGFTLLFNQQLFLVLLPFAVVLAVWRGIKWTIFSVCIIKQQIMLRSLRGFVIDEQVFWFNLPDGLWLRQNMSGYVLDYGQLRIEVSGEPVQIPYIAPFSSLRRQLDNSW